MAAQKPQTSKFHDKQWHSEPFFAFVYAQCQFRPRANFFIRFYLHQESNKWQYRTMYSTLWRKKHQTNIFMYIWNEELNIQLALVCFFSSFLVFVFSPRLDECKTKVFYFVFFFDFFLFLHWNFNDVNWTVKLDVLKSAK